MTILSRALCVLMAGVCVSSGVLSRTACADDSSKFYTVIDQDGHMRSIQKKAADSDSPNSSPASISDQSSADPILMMDGQQYVDSEYLEKRKFNLAGKKTFYAMPDGMGGTQVIERVPGGVNKEDHVPEKTEVSSEPLVSLSTQYERVPAVDIISLINMKCLSGSALDTAKVLRDQQLIIWPRSDAPMVNHRTGLNYVVIKFGLNNRDISLQSVAPLGRQSDYYWPLPIFLDEQGCVLEGVNAFYQKTLPSTMLQPSVLVGNLHVPEHAKYLMLTPLHDAIDLPNIRLSEVGQIRLIPLR
ncbi:MAG: putative pilus assembly protein FilE [Gammaproteobacteria bacterium]|nr:putative pilus assembly protein FilE [Gammaproteobacteria bacterium]